MQCFQARQRLIDGDIDDATKAHLSACEACAELAADDARLARTLGVPALPESPDLDEAFAASFARELEAERTFGGRLRAFPTRVRIAIGVVGSSLLGIAVYFISPRPDLAAYPIERLAFLMSGFVVFIAVAVALALPRIYRPARPVPVQLGALAAILVAGFVPALLPVAHASGGAVPSFWAGVGQCVGFGSVVAIPVVLFVRALQRDRPLTTWPTLFLAATAALAAHLALQMHCGVVDRGHIGVAHSSLGVLYALLAFVIVRIAWTLRPDKRRPV